MIFATLVLQGLTLPAVIRWSGVHDDGAEAREELLARRRATEAALAQLDELEGQEWTRDDTVERMRGMYRYRVRRLDARAGEQDDDDGDDYEHRSRKYQKMVRSVLDAQRGRSWSCATRARSPTTSCTGSSASSTSRTSGWRSRGTPALGAGFPCGYSPWGRNPARCVGLNTGPGERAAAPCGCSPGGETRALCRAQRRPWGPGSLAGVRPGAEPPRCVRLDRRPWGPGAPLRCSPRGRSRARCLGLDAGPGGRVPLRVFAPEGETRALFGES